MPRGLRTTGYPMDRAAARACPRVSARAYRGCGSPAAVSVCRQVLVAAPVSAVEGQSGKREPLGDLRGGDHQGLVVAEHPGDPTFSGDLGGGGHEPFAVGDEPCRVDQRDDGATDDVRPLPGRLGGVQKPEWVVLSRPGEQVLAVAPAAAAYDEHDGLIAVCHRSPLFVRPVVGPTGMPRHGVTTAAPAATIPDVQH